MVKDMQSLGQFCVEQQSRRGRRKQNAVSVMQALTMITATLGFNCPKNVLMLGWKCEGVGNSVACTKHIVIDLGQSRTSCTEFSEGTFSGKFLQRTARAALLAVITT